MRESEFLGVQADRQLVYYASVTREAFHHTGRITDLITSGKLAHDLGRPALSAEDDRVMICGNPEMLVELKAELVGWGFGEGSSGEPGAFVIEKAFAER